MSGWNGSTASCGRPGHRKLSVRPRRRARPEGAVEAFKKNPPTCPDRSGAQGPGAMAQGARPSASRDQRTASTYILNDLPQDRCRHVGASVVQRGGDGPASGRNRSTGHVGQAPRAAGRSGRVAGVRASGRAAHHHHRPVAREVSRAEPGEERLSPSPGSISRGKPDRSTKRLRRDSSAITACRWSGTSGLALSSGRADGTFPSVIEIGRTQSRSRADYCTACLFLPSLSATPENRLRISFSISRRKAATSPR